MSTRIAALDESNAPEASRPLLAQVKKTFGKVPNLFATFAHSPHAFSAFLAWNAAVMESSLSPRERGAVMLHVSQLNGCPYCVSAYSFLAERSGMSGDEIDAARAGQGAAPREAALLALARRIVRTGGAGAGAELAAAREAGVSDAEVVDVVAIVALKQFTNAVGLIARPEIDFPPAPRLPEP